MCALQARCQGSIPCVSRFSDGGYNVMVSILPCEGGRAGSSPVSHPNFVVIILVMISKNLIDESSLKYFWDDVSIEQNSIPFSTQA